MSYKLFYWIVSLFIAVFALIAYTFPVEAVQPPSETQNSRPATQQDTLTPQGTATAPQALFAVIQSATPTGPSAITFTPTYSVPMLTLRDATNCRTGPGKSYEIIVTYPVDQTLEMVGQYDSGNFWLVKSGESPTGTCWLWGEYADVAGSYWSVTSVTPPPTPVLVPPQAPSLQDYKYYCDGFSNTISFNIIWKDRASNETGYRIFRDGWLVAELPAGSTTFAETISMPVSRGAEYSVQAYNAAGSAQMPVRKLTCDR